jgi:glycosyltransferase involved in cell wall biosynthesis
MTITVLVNMSTLVVGGGVQLGVSFFEFASKFKSNDFQFHFILSGPIFDNLEKNKLNNSHFELSEDSPAKIFKGWKSRRKILELEKNINPDIVYSLGFPSYIRFKNIEIGRYTNPWEIFPTKMAWNLLPPRERLFVWLKAKYRIQWAKNVSYYETQSIPAKVGIIKLLGLPDKKVKVIPNCCNPIFLNHKFITKKRKTKNEKIIFCLAAAFRHKNLLIIPKTLKHLNTIAPELETKFILTLPFDSDLWFEIDAEAKVLGVENNIKNIGPLKLQDTIIQYEDSDVVFMPTMLEVFSATYLEAMTMNRPIVTSDLSFAHDICGEAALYFDPNSPISAAESIHSVIKDSKISDKLIENGAQQILTFPDALHKHNLVIDWLRKISELEAIR